MKPFLLLVSPRAWRLCWSLFVDDAILSTKQVDALIEQTWAQVLLLVVEKSPLELGVVAQRSVNYLDMLNEAVSNGLWVDFRSLL